MGALLVAVATGALAGCTSTAGSAEPPIPLTATVDSPRALGRAVLDALRREDAARLSALALSEGEFRDLVWPELPSSTPAVGLPLDYAWRALRQKSDADLRRTLAALGGRSLQFVKIGFVGETTDFGSFRVHRDAWLEVRTESGAMQRVRVFGSMIEYAGRVKVFSYVVE